MVATARSETGQGDGHQVASETVISARGLRICYGDFEAVRGIDLEVSRGEVFAFLGPNGAGKTTTVELLEGYLGCDGGSRQTGCTGRGAHRLLAANVLSTACSWLENGSAWFQVTDSRVVFFEDVVDTVEMNEVDLRVRFRDTGRDAVFHRAGEVLVHVATGQQHRGVGRELCREGGWVVAVDLGELELGSIAAGIEAVHDRGGQPARQSPGPPQGCDGALGRLAHARRDGPGAGTKKLSIRAGTGSSRTTAWIFGA